MNGKLTQTQRRVSNNVLFLLYALVTFAVFSTFLFIIDFVPERQVTQADEGVYITETQETTSVSEDNTSEHVDTRETQAIEVSRVPLQIIIQSIGVDTSIIAPESTSIDVLDRALLLGAVHYPGSADLGEKGNVLLFGHSSHLPVVRNKAYKAFNDIDELEAGDEIRVLSDTHEFIYEVQHVSLEKAQNAKVYFDASLPMLTLVTCDNFGSEEDRWIATAMQVSKKQFKN